MTINNKVWIIFSMLLIITNDSFAKIKLPSIIGSNMVIQQNTEAKLWGWANPNTKIRAKASWSKQSYFAAVDDNGKWQLKITTPTAGGPYEIKFSDDDGTVIISNVLIGEVWVCSGQSNMWMPVQGHGGLPVNNSIDMIAEANIPSIRLFTVKGKVSAMPIEDCEGEWVESTTKSAAEFSAVGYSFGKYLYQILKRPIGLISTSWGGTWIETWISEDVLRKFNYIDLSTISTNSDPGRTPALLYNAMINPLIGFTIKGAIWYQGESNIDRADKYPELFTSMVKLWREKWAVGDFPFYYVQIAPFSYYWVKNINSAFLREAQLKALSTIPFSAMVSTMDIGDELNVHPAEKFTIGKRLAFCALNNDYGMKGIPYSGPEYKSMNMKGNQIELFFDNAPLGLTSFSKELSGFEIAGEDKIFHPAKAIINDKANASVVVSSDSVLIPVAVRYCWRNWCMGSLFNVEGLPSSSFRTDNWGIK